MCDVNARRVVARMENVLAGFAAPMFKHNAVGQEIPTRARDPPVSLGVTVPRVDKATTPPGCLLHNPFIYRAAVDWSAHSVMRFHVHMFIMAHFCVSANHLLSLVVVAGAQQNDNPDRAPDSCPHPGCLRRGLS